jgi:hypothetical protein
MKKLRLDVTDLQVQSFAPAVGRESAPRAVRGYEATLGQRCESLCFCVIGWSEISCPDQTCSCPV